MNILQRGQGLGLRKKSLLLPVDNLQEKREAMHDAGASRQFPARHHFNAPVLKSMNDDEHEEK